MFRIPTWLFSLTLIAALFHVAHRAEAWQSPEELPSAPRMRVANVAPATGFDATTPPPAVIIDQPSETDGDFSIINPPPAPAPAIVPVEDIIAAPAMIGPTARRNSPRVIAPITPAFQPEPETSNSEESPLATTLPLKATLFKQAEPGVTAIETLKELWGEPNAEQAAGTATTLTFSLAPFSRVDANITAGIVQSIVVHFETPADVAATASQLGLDTIEPVDEIGLGGKVIARAYPERGVTFILAPEGDKIARLRLAPLTANGFLQRVLNDRENRWTQNLADLTVAGTLSPDDARVHWLRAEVLTQQAEYRDAVNAIEKAIQAQPESHLYQLTAAQLLAHAGHYEDAIAATSTVFQSKELPRLLKAKAALQLGDLLAESPRRDFAKALEFHQYTIKVAVPLATHEQRDIRLAAKHLLIDAHAAIAGDIAQGTWQNKAQSVPQWADRSQALVDEYIANEIGVPSVAFEILCRRLDAYAWVNGEIDPTDAVAELGRAYDGISTTANDATFVRHVNWQYGKAMIDAVDIERARGNAGNALEYGKLAEQALGRIADDQWRTENTQFQFSRLYFLLGSVQAVHRDNHAAAVSWFDKAIDNIARPEPDQDLTKTARRGHWLVSMGVSYWQNDRRDDALRMTQVGVRLIEKAQAAGATSDSSLAAPFNNLAFMHEQLGDKEKAKEFAALAEKHKTPLQR